MGAPADEQVVEVGERHHSRRKRYGITLEALGISGAVPFLLVRIHDVHRAPEKLQVAECILRALEHVASDRGVRLHDRELIRRELALFVEDRIGNAGLPHVVQWHALENELARSARQMSAEPRV